MANNLPNPEKNLPNPTKETVSNLSDKEGKIFGNSTYNEIVKKEYYDSEKTKIKTEKTYKKGVLYSQYNYNEDGTKQKTIYYDENGKMRSESEYNNGHLIKHTDYRNGNVWMDHEYNILEDGTKQKTIFYDENGKMRSEIEYNNGHLIKYTDYSRNSIYDYDEKGNNIKTTIYNPDGSINHYYIYDYDSTGKK